MIERTHFEMPLTDFEPGGRLVSYSDARDYFKRSGPDSWAAYVAGAFLVLMREKSFIFRQGASIVIDSKVPEGKGPRKALNTNGSIN